MLEDVKYKTAHITISGKSVEAQFFKTEGDPNEHPETVFADLAEESRVLYTVAIALSADGGQIEQLGVVEGNNIRIVEGYSHSSSSEQDAVSFLSDAILHTIKSGRNTYFPKEKGRTASVLIQRRKVDSSGDWR